MQKIAMRELLPLFLSISLADPQNWFVADLVIPIHSNLSFNHETTTNFVHNEEPRYEPIGIVGTGPNVTAKNQFIRNSEQVSTQIYPLNEFGQKVSSTVAAFVKDRIKFNVTHTKPLKNSSRRRKCPALGSKLGIQKPRVKNGLRPAKTYGTSKFLDVFHVINIHNIGCTSSNGLEGVCLHQYECATSGGISLGDCADGYGACCVVQSSCGDSSSSSMTWFTNPGFPSPSAERLSCALSLDKARADVLQIRLDMMTFELLPPSEGSCELDQFQVSGQNTNSIIPILCGINNGQHLYVEVGDVPGPIYFSFQTVTSDSRLFAIKITQLTASDELVVPTGCLQYYTNAQGVLESFNYQDKSALLLSKSPSYLNNMNYAMCIQRAPETCSITYTNAEVFQIPNYDSDGLPVIPAEQAGVEIFNCPADWLLAAAARLCGERLNDGSVLQDFSLNAPITDSATGPIIVWFRSDSGSVGRGFRLQYIQNACTTS